MIEQEKETAFERRLTRSEKEISTLVTSVSRQGENIAAMTTAIETQTKQIGALLHRTDKPFPIATTLIGIGLAVTLLGLALAPLYSDDTIARSFDIKVMQHIEQDAHDMGVIETELKWLKKMEDRLNQRIHRAIIAVD